MKWMSLIIALLFLVPATFLAKGKREQPKVSMEQAQKIALEKEPGTVHSQQLEKERGKLIYRFTFAPPARFTRPKLTP